MINFKPNEFKTNQIQVQVRQGREAKGLYSLQNIVFHDFATYAIENITVMNAELYSKATKRLSDLIKHFQILIISNYKI